ncbi:MAG: hypothetical protein U1G05_20180 [Kiritimatiellia bacterium]
MLDVPMLSVVAPEAHGVGLKARAGGCSGQMGVRPAQTATPGRQLTT